VAPVEPQFRAIDDPECEACQWEYWKKFSQQREDERIFLWEGTLSGWMIKVT